MRRTARIGILLVAGGIAASLTAGSASAESGVCINLQQQYLTATRGSAPVPGAQNAGALRASLAAAELAANANHCRSFGIFQPGPTSACPAVMQEVDRLQASLRQSTGVNASNGFFGFNAVPRSPADQLRDELVVNGCAIPDPNSLGYRALCVRACDGYYFPISSSSDGGGSAADAASCQATYGGAVKAEVFLAPLSGEIADARSLTGARYGDQPYAFSYRTKFNAVCVAQLRDGLAALGTRNPAPATARATSSPVPALALTRLRLSEVAATPVAVAGTGVVAKPVPTSATQAGTVPVMRVVGASYYNLILDQGDLAARPVPATPALRALR